MDRQDRALKVLEELTIELHRKNDLLDYTAGRPDVKAPAPPRVVELPAPERIPAKKVRSEFAYRFTNEFKPGLPFSRDKIEIRVELLGSCLYAQRERANFKMPIDTDEPVNLVNVFGKVEDDNQVCTRFKKSRIKDAYQKNGINLMRVSDKWLDDNSDAIPSEDVRLNPNKFEELLIGEIKNSTSKDSPNEISTLSKDEVLIVNFKHRHGSRLALLKYDKPFVYANGGEGWFLLDDTDALKNAFLHQDGFKIISKNKPIPFFKNESVTITDIVPDTSGVQLKAKTNDGSEIQFLLKNYRS